MEQIENNILESSNYHHEEQLVCFFEKVKKYEEKEFHVVILSKRFYLIYEILSKKYPNIALKNIHYLSESEISKIIISGISTNKQILYLNDIPYEFPSTIKNWDLIFVYIYTDYLYVDDYDYISRINTTDKIKSLSFSKNERERYKYRLRYYINSYNSSRKILEFIARETVFLMQNGFKNAINLVPDFLVDFYEFQYENRELLAYFIREFYSKLREPIINEMWIEFKYNIIKKIKEKYGEENISQELITFLKKGISYKDIDLYNIMNECEENNCLERKKIQIKPQ